MNRRMHMLALTATLVALSAPGTLAAQTAQAVPERAIATQVSSAAATAPNITTSDTQTASAPSRDALHLQPSAVRTSPAAPALDATAPAPPTRDQSRVMMVVGGAAFVVGAIVGNDAGTVIMVGGLVVGLFGLYNYLQ